VPVIHGPSFAPEVKPNNEGISYQPSFDSFMIVGYGGHEVVSSKSMRSRSLQTI
jgi:hypothetical protein